MQLAELCRSANHAGTMRRMIILRPKPVVCEHAPMICPKACRARVYTLLRFCSSVLDMGAAEFCLASDNGTSD